MFTHLFGPSDTALSFAHHYTAAEYRQAAKSIIRAICAMVIDECVVELNTPEGPNATVIITCDKKTKQYGIKVHAHVSGHGFETMPVYNRWLYLAMLDFYTKLKSQYAPVKEQSMQEALSFLDKVKDVEYLTKREKELQSEKEKENKQTSNCIPPVITGAGAVSSITTFLNDGLVTMLNGNSGVGSSFGMISDKLTSDISEQISNIRDVAEDSAQSIRDIERHVVKKHKTSARASTQRPVSFRRRMYK